MLICSAGMKTIIFLFILNLSHRVAHLTARGRRFQSQLGHTTFVEIDHEIVSATILRLLLIQEGQLSVKGKIYSQSSVKHLED